MASKYIKGERIQSLDELIRQEFIYFNHKVYHRGWVMGWKLKWVVDMIGRGLLFIATRKQEDIK